MDQQTRQAKLDQLAELVSTQGDIEARRRRLIHQLHFEGACSLAEIADAADLTRQGVRYLLLTTAGGPEKPQAGLRDAIGADHA